MAEDLQAQSAAKHFECDAKESHLHCVPHTVHLTALKVSQPTNTGEKVATGEL